MEDITRGMGEMMGMAQSDPTKMLSEEHKKVNDLFGEFERATDMEKRGKVFADIVKNLNAHASVEEAVFYPAAERVLGDRQMVMQSLQEHMQIKEHLSHIAMLMGREAVSQQMSGMRGETYGTEPGMQRREPMDTDIRTERETMRPDYPESGRGTGVLSSGSFASGEKQAMGEYQPRTEAEMRSSETTRGMEPTQPGTGYQQGMGTQPGMGTESRAQMGGSMGLSGTYMDHYQMLKQTVMKHVQMEENQMFPMMKQAIPEDQLGKIASMMFATRQALM